MADAKLTVLDYRRTVAQGLSRDRGRWLLHMDKDDVLALSIDWTRWLDGETVSSVTYTATSITQSGATETSGVTTANLSALKGDPASLQVQVTTSAGRKLTQHFRVLERLSLTRDAYAV